MLAKSVALLCAAFCTVGSLFGNVSTFADYGKYVIAVDDFGPNDSRDDYYLYRSPNENGRSDSVLNLYNLNTGDTKQIFAITGNEYGNFAVHGIENETVTFIVNDKDGSNWYFYDIESGETTTEPYVSDPGDIRYILDTRAEIEIGGGQKAYFKKDFAEKELLYSVNGEDYEEIASLDYKSGVFGQYLKYEDGYVYGVITSYRGLLKGPNTYQTPDDAKNSEISNEILFSFNVKTKEFKTLYTARKGKQRIIGYADDYVYIWKKNALYKQQLGSKKKTKVYTVNAKDNVGFCWFGNKLLVFDGDEYKVETVIEEL